MITLDAIAASPALATDLAETFDFDLRRAARDHQWVKLSIDTPFTVIAGDCTGGVFIAYGSGERDQRPILYASSEGQAGRIAGDLTHLVGLLLALPHWMDLLKYSGGGNLEEMRKAKSSLEDADYLDTYPDLAAARERIQSGLRVALPADPVAELHRQVQATDCTLVAVYGWQYTTLFGTYTC